MKTQRKLKRKVKVEKHDENIMKTSEIRNWYKPVMIGIRVPVMMKVALEGMANANGKLLSQFCRELLEKGIDWDKLHQKLRDEYKV